MTTTILLTGASGLIGFRILLHALEAGHNVRVAVRSEEKAQKVASNPAILKLGAAAGERLSSVVIPDLTVDGVFDSVLQGVTHIIHTGSPVGLPELDPRTEIYEPTVKMAANLLKSALKAPTVQRVVITTSGLANIGFAAGPETVSAATRVPPPDPIPETFSNGVEAYITGKLVEARDTDTFIQTQNAHFTVSRIFPGFVFGRNELSLNTAMMQTQNSSNNLMMMGMLGGEVPFPLFGRYAHVDDVAELHMRVALEDRCAGKDFGIAFEVDYDTIFDHVEKRYPEAVKAGVFKRGTVPIQPVVYDSSDAEALLGKVKSFEEAVLDVAGQYLELLKAEQ
ncbi:NAD(P)-binding protein [Cryphonectria parasitica EP155]|uniref:NAD(P)-binding protein n=1 Tax=Cryphonectria parasitica (strain ATCC 38755 / EP155) TaxID=660469 RepID=A0A9P5CLA7_CRYP1|nr:NAD(P)-binding protein [Cryphonectria parasitica EP155]KAF3761826.1 NAD(P)-binding protein [Cryphonectria parasitica EP155]